MWRKNEGREPTGNVVSVELRDGTIFAINDEHPKEWLRWGFAKGTNTPGHEANDIIEYDDGQEPEWQCNDIVETTIYPPNHVCSLPLSEIEKIRAANEALPPKQPVRPYSSTFSAVPVVKKMFGVRSLNIGRAVAGDGPIEVIYENQPNFSGFAQAHEVADAALRAFETGATRHNDADKYDYEGFLSPIALEAFAAYMHVNRRTVDGGLRDSDNWQKGIPVNAYMKSKWRHDFEMWKSHRGFGTEEGELAAACGVLFNTMGWIHEKAKADPEWFERELAKFKEYRAAEIASRK